MTAFDALARIGQGLAQLGEHSLLRKRRMLESAQGARVRVDGRELLSFCSNDYLGLADDPALGEAARAAIQENGVGAGASHLVTGHHRLHHEFEAAFAEFVGKPASLLFSTGYMANLGVLTALLGRHGAVFADRINHASLNDAALQCGAKFTRYAHGDLDQLQAQLEKSAARDKLICSDLVFSMDGDVAQVERLQFRDYDFDGSNINVLLDVLAYNTFKNSFYTNMLFAESFLDTAQLRGSIISHAKELNYTPRSARSSRARVKVDFEATGAGQPYIITKGQTLSAIVKNSNFSFAIPETISVASANNSFSFETDIYEGVYVQDSYIFQQPGEAIPRFRLN